VEWQKSRKWACPSASHCEVIAISRLEQKVGADDC
jgi:hypothetical protein